MEFFSYDFNPARRICISAFRRQNPVMKPTALAFSFLILLASCGSMSLLERKYRPGFYLERKGDRAVAIKKAAEVPAAQDGRAKTAKVAAGSNACAEKATPDLTITPLSHDTVQRKELHGDTKVAPVPQKPASPPDTPEEQEKKEITTAFRYALLATGLFVFMWLALIFLVSAFFFAFIMLVLSFAFAMAGFRRARKIRERHAMDEDYPGKKKVVFAITAGWVYLALVAGSVLAGIIGIAFLLMSLYR